MKIIKTQTNNPVDHDTFIHQPDASKTRVANIPGKRLPFPDPVSYTHLTLPTILRV